MQHLDLYTRKTFKYRDAWSHEDEWDYLSSIKLTPPAVVDEGNGYDRGVTYLQHARLPAGADSRQFRRAIANTLSGDRCRHDYDCCGCASRSVFTRMLSKRDVLIVSTVSYNY